MKTEDLSTLRIHQMSQSQYDRELAAGNIETNSIYLTPDEEVSFDEFHTLGRRKAIPKGADFNTYITPGVFCTASNVDAQTMINCPIGTAGELIVEYRIAPEGVSWGHQYVTQTYRTFNGYEYVRYTSDSGATWKSWEAYSSTLTKNVFVFLIDSSSNTATLESGGTALELYNAVLNGRDVVVKAHYESSPGDHYVYFNLKGDFFAPAAFCEFEATEINNLNTSTETIFVASDGTITYNKVLHGIYDSVNETYFNELITNDGEKYRWTFRVWDSGVAECWGVYPFKYSTTINNGIYVTGDQMTIELPSHIFDQSPVVTVTPMGGGYPKVNIGNIYNTHFTISICTEWAVTDMPMWLQVHCIGTI